VGVRLPYTGAVRLPCAFSAALLLVLAAGCTERRPRGGGGGSAGGAEDAGRDTGVGDTGGSGPAARDVAPDRETSDAAPGGGRGTAVDLPSWPSAAAPPVDAEPARE